MISAEVVTASTIITGNHSLVWQSKQTNQQQTNKLTGLSRHASRKMTDWPGPSWWFGKGCLQQSWIHLKKRGDWLLSWPPLSTNLLWTLPRNTSSPCGIPKNLNLKTCLQNPDCFPRSFLMPEERKPAKPSFWFYWLSQTPAWENIKPLDSSRLELSIHLRPPAN